MFASLLGVKSKKPEEPKQQVLAEDVQILLVQLEHIRELALKKNTYQLDSTEKQNLTITLNTLSFLVKHLDDESRRFGLRRDVCVESAAPIHFDTLPIRDYKPEERRTFLIQNYVDPFIEGFNNVVSATDIRKKNFVKVFCSRLYGNCVEMRTRKVLSFGYKLKTDAPNWDERYTNAKFCLDTFALDGKNLIINGKPKVENNDKPKVEAEEAKKPSPEENYEHYLSLPENQNTLIALTTRFFEDDFDLTIKENRELAHNAIRHLCYTKPESAGVILYNNIHKKNKEILIDWLIENNANLNHEEKVEDKVINTFHRAVCHGASKKLVANLIDYGATIHHDMINETLTAALKYCGVDCIETLITEYAKYASSLHTYLHYNKSSKEDKADDKKTTKPKEIVPVITDQKIVDAVDYPSAKLKLLQAMVQAQGEGCEFLYSKADKSFYLGHLLEQLQACQSIGDCFRLFKTNIDSKILNYERIINKSALTFQAKETLTSSTQQFIKATQERVFQLLSSDEAKKQLILNYYELRAALSHPLFELAMYTPEVYEQKLLPLYNETKKELFALDKKGNFIAFHPKTASKFLTNPYVVTGLQKDQYLAQVFNFMCANIKQYPDSVLADIYKCLRGTGQFHEESIKGLQKQFTAARNPTPPMINLGSSLLGNTSLNKKPPTQNGHSITVAPPITAKSSATLKPKKITIGGDDEVKIDPKTGRAVLPPNWDPEKAKDQPSTKPVTKPASNGTASSHAAIQMLIKVKFDVSLDGKVNVILLKHKSLTQQAQPNKNDATQTHTKSTSQSGTKEATLSNGNSTSAPPVPNAAYSNSNATKAAPLANGNKMKPSPFIGTLAPPVPISSPSNINVFSETLFGSQPTIDYFQTLDTVELSDKTPTRYRHNPKKK